MTQRTCTIVALSGDIGTGTTTLGRNLASTLGWKHVNAGDYMRAWHAKHNIPIERTDQIPEDVDRHLDEQMYRDMTASEHMVFESHLAGWLAMEVPHALKILCVCDEAVTMRRVASREGLPLAEATATSRQRSTLMNAKFASLYNVANPYDRSLFDVVIDTTHLSAGQVLDEALRQIMKVLPDGDERAKVLDIG